MNIPEIIYSSSPGIASALRHFDDLHSRLIEDPKPVFGRSALAIIDWSNETLQVEEVLKVCIKNGFANFLIVFLPEGTRSPFLQRLQTYTNYNLACQANLSSIDTRCRCVNEWQVISDSFSKAHHLKVIELVSDDSPVNRVSNPVLDRTASNEVVKLSKDTAGFEAAAQTIQKYLQDSPNLNVRLNIDSLQNLNPLNSENEIFGMLILAFPEVRFIFNNEFPTSDSTTLFDGTGLRERIRSEARKTNNESIASYLPARSTYACAIDDEEGYTFFNAYTAYRNGFRAFAINRYDEAKSVLRNSINHLIFGDPIITFEDVFLNFPDKENKNEGPHLSRLGTDRKQDLPVLEKVVHRRFVTSSQTVTGKDGAHAENGRFISSIGALEISKPLSGMFDLWTKANLHRCLKWRDEKTGKWFRGVGEGFHWPPPIRLLEASQGCGHGSPGRLLQVAELMIWRAEKMLQQGVTSVREAVTGAVLATDAIELLGNRTPTTSIEALGLKHQFEVIAECQFSGTEYHIEILPRLREIKHECQELVRWFNPDQAKMAAWNAEMHIVNQLVRILREYNQFDEEAICMNRVRRLHNRLWVRRKPIVFRPFLIAMAGYASWLMSSFLNFAISFFGCVMLLGGLRWWVEQRQHTWDDMPSSTFLRSLVIGTQDVFAFFVGANGFDKESWGLSLVLGLAAILGLIHLGIFLSFLYSIISRKS